MQAEEKLAADAAAPEEAQRPALAALVRPELKAQHVAHRGLKTERLVVLRRAAGQHVRGDVQVELRLHDRPQARDEVEPAVQRGQDQGELQALDVDRYLVPDPVPDPGRKQGQQRVPEPPAECHVAGVGVQQLQRQPDQARCGPAILGAVAVVGLERAVADDVEDRADPVPLGDDDGERRLVEAGPVPLFLLPLGLADLREPVAQQPLVQREGAEVVVGHPAAQRLVLREQPVQPVRGAGDGVDGVAPVVGLLRRELEPSPARQLGDRVDEDLVQPGLGGLADQRGGRRERDVELCLDPVRLVDDDQVAHPAGQLQVADPLAALVRRDRAVHEARRGRHPDLGCHQVAGTVVPGAPAPQRAAPAGRPVRGGPAPVPVFLIPSVLRLVQRGAGRVSDPQRPVRLRSAEGIEGAGARQVPEAGAVVGHHGGRAGCREAPVQPVDVPLAGGLPQHRGGCYADPAEGVGHRERLRHVAHHDGDPPLVSWPLVTYR